MVSPFHWGKMYIKEFKGIFLKTLLAQQNMITKLATLIKIIVKKAKQRKQTKRLGSRGPPNFQCVCIELN